MTDFGARTPVGAATTDEQDQTQVKLDTLHTDLAKLHSQATHTLVDDITFDDDPITYTSSSVDSEDYRDLSLLIDLAIVDTPTDIVIRLQESDDDTTFYTIMNGPFGDIRYEDAAGDKTEAIHGKVCAPYLRAYVVATGTGTTHKFTLTLKVILTK